MPTPRVTPEEEITNPHPVGTQEWDEWESNHPKQPPQTGGIGKENGTMAATGVQQDVNMGDGETKQPSPTTSLPTPTDADGKNYSGYDDILAMMQQAQKRTKEDEESARRQERLARAHSFIGGIGDLGRALANLYYTNQYAPNGYDHKDSLSEKAKARADKWRAERQRLQKEYYNYAMQGANAKVGRERAKAADERAQKQQAYRDKQLDLYYQREERMQQEADRKERMADWQKEFQQGQLDLKKAEIELRKWIKQGAMSRSKIEHHLDSWKRTTRYIFNDRGKVIGKEEQRIVMNPDGTLSTESSIKYDDGQGGGSSQQGGRKANPMGGGQSGTGGKKKNPMG